MIQPEQLKSFVWADHVVCEEKKEFTSFGGGPVAQIKFKLFFSKFFDNKNSDKWLTPHRVFYGFYLTENSALHAV